MDILHTFLLIGHVIGVALGAGGATMSDILFLTSISDNRIDKSELRLLKIASKVVVLGLILLTITGVGFIVTGSPTSPRFWAKITIVVIAALNGLVMHKVFFPIFERCVKDKIPVSSAEFTRYTPLLAIAGPLSAISWYAALILGIWRTLTLTYAQYLIVYGLLVTGTIAISALALDFMIKNQSFFAKFWPIKPANEEAEVAPAYLREQTRSLQ